MYDLDIRTSVKKTFLKKYYSDNESKVVDELSVSYGDARVDIAVINGSLHGYEIKSDYDTLKRLPNQISIYSKTFDYLTIISGECHLENVLSLTPNWCGVILASKKKKSNDIKFQSVRPAERNLEIDKLSVAQLLWKEELISALKYVGIEKGLNNKSKPFLWNMLIDNTSITELSSIVRSHLKLRANWKSELQFAESDGYFQLFAKL